MEAELKELKTVLRALVVSSPSQVDAHSLLRDYRQMVGANIPVAKYGYRDALGFLKERCSDCFLFQGPSNNPILTLIVPETLKHIDKFVQSQRPSTTTKFKGKRRSVPGNVLQPEPEPIFKSSKDTISVRPITKTNCNGTTRPSPPSKDEKAATVNDVPRVVKKQTTVNERPKVTKQTSVNDLSKVNKASLNNTRNHNVQNNSADKSESSSHNAVKNFLKKKTPLYNDVESEYCERTSSKDDNDSGRLTSSSSSSSKAARLEELKREIQDLLAAHPDGVICTDLLRLYRERYHRELCFEKFGYTSIVSLLCVMEDAVSMSRAGVDGERLLRDARAGPAPPRPPARRPPPAARAPSPRLVDVDDALPGIDYDPDVFPADCMHFMESIPAQSLTGLEPGAMLEVIVGEVYSPSHFWLIRLGDHYHLAMENIMDQMNEYYINGEGKDRFLAVGAIRVGHYCTSLYERDWHRSLIVSIIDSETVKVRHVDYGTVDLVPARALKPLRRGWGALPAQAVRARLAGVRPPAGGRRWPHAAAAHLLHLVRDARLVANLVAHDKQEDVLEVFLVDTSSEEDVCINSELVRAGYADPRSDSAVRTGDCYLLPTFEALETGATPNYAEIDGYLRDGISLDYVDDYRRHVPHCLPPCPPPVAPPSPPPSPPPPPPPPPTPPSPPVVPFMTRVPLFPAPAEAEASPRSSARSSPRFNRSEPSLAVSRATSPLPSSLSQPAMLASPAPAPSPAGGVTLSAAECEMFRYLSSVDLTAAHWYMMGALGRTTPALNAHAPEFRPRALLRPPPIYMHPAQYPMHPGPPPMHFGPPSMYSGSPPMPSGPPPFHPAPSPFYPSPMHLRPPSLQNSSPAKSPIHFRPPSVQNSSPVVSPSPPRSRPPPGFGSNV